MNKPWLMGIDLGGSGARCVLVNRSSGALVSTGQLAIRRRAGHLRHRLRYRPRAGMGGCRQRPAAVRCEQAQIESSAVAAIAVSAMRFSTVVLGADGKSLLAVDNRDARAAGEYFEVAEKMGQQLLQETGCWPLPLHASARLLWLKNQQPDKFSQAQTVFGMGEWLTWRLSGVRAIDATLASATGLFHLTAKAWCWQRHRRTRPAARDLSPADRRGLRRRRINR